MLMWAWSSGEAMWLAWPRISCYRLCFNRLVLSDASGRLNHLQDKDMVERLLSLKQRLDEVLDSAFARNEAFGSAQKEAFESFINQRQNKVRRRKHKAINWDQQPSKPHGPCMFFRMLSYSAALTWQDTWLDKKIRPSISFFAPQPAQLISNLIDLKQPASRHSHTRGIRVLLRYKLLY